MRSQALIFFLLAASSLASAEPSNGTKRIERWSSIPIAREEVFFVIPDGFPMTVSWESKQGVDAYQGGFIPEGQSKENWNDTIRFMAFRGTPPGDSPAKQMLGIIEQRIRASCPTDFLLEEKEQSDGKRSAAIMGCRKLNNGAPRTTFGYYLAIQGSEYMYVMARESRSEPFSGELPLSKATRDLWQAQTDKTTICRRNEICITKAGR